MPFSPKIKYLARKRAAFRCCVCHEKFVEVHHLIPEAEGGPSTIENAAPLCARCHDLFGGNPEKRAQLRQMRDDWWEKMDQRHLRLTDPSDDDPPYEVLSEPHFEASLRNNKDALYYLVREEETFEEAASTIMKFICEAQKQNPNVRRALYIDILGHAGAKPKKGKRRLRFDSDMMELQVNFLPQLILKYVSDIHMPLWSIRNKKMQINDVPENVSFIDIGNKQQFLDAIQSGVREIHISCSDIVIRTSKTFDASECMEVIKPADK